MEGLNFTEITDLSLWKATRKLKCLQQTEQQIQDKTNQRTRNEKEKVEIFVIHLQKSFHHFKLKFGRIGRCKSIFRIPISNGNVNLEDQT